MAHVLSSISVIWLEQPNVATKVFDLERSPGLLPELLELLEIIDLLGSHVQVRELATVTHRGLQFPLLALTIGSADRSVPTLGLFGGVHGLERIGTRVVLAYLRSLGAQLRWDSHLRALLQRSRLVAIPIVNPMGMYLQRRANANGVDLMRNAPIHAASVPDYHLHAGHRLSPRLPWYRGAAGQPMEVEARALCEFVRTELFSAPVAISVDVHSGYGTRDRLWFPYARTAEPFPHRAEIVAIKELFDAAHPYHIYCIEPQSRNYLAHGDLWDYLYDEHDRISGTGLFLPFCLELGSWIWMKKSVKQILSLFGLFNPIAVHRQRRTLRRHLLLFDFLLRVAASSETWTTRARAERAELSAIARALWYDTD
jgi:hypothetical protein